MTAKMLDQTFKLTPKNGVKIQDASNSSPSIIAPVNANLV